MDERRWNINSIKLGDYNTSDIIILLSTKEDRRVLIHTHSSVLKDKSAFFAHKISQGSQIEIQCSELDYFYHVELVKRLYHPRDSLIGLWNSVRSTIGILQVASLLGCEEIVQSGVCYLEAVPWEDKEEEQIIKLAARLGSVAMPMLARIEPVDLVPTKNVFISAIRFATSINESIPPFGDDLKTSAQEQIEYMLTDDDDVPMITADDEVKMEARRGLSNLFSCFSERLSTFVPDLETEENKVMQSLTDLEWMCNVLPKMDLMKDFVVSWAEMSENTLAIMSDQKFEAVFWGTKVKLIEIATKVLDAAGYGNVIVPAQCRFHLLKTWLPYIRKMKPLVDSMVAKEANFPHKMDEDLCQSIEGAIVSLILTLPSNDQGEIFADWMSAEEVTYPDLSEAFEVWCFRTKSANRRLVEGLDRAGNGNNVISL